MLYTYNTCYICRPSSEAADITNVAINISVVYNKPVKTTHTFFFQDTLSKRGRGSQEQKDEQSLTAKLKKLVNLTSECNVAELGRKK